MQLAPARAFARLVPLQKLQQTAIGHGGVGSGSDLKQVSDEDGLGRMSHPPILRTCPVLIIAITS